VAYSKEFTLKNIGNVLGTVVKIDQLTLTQSRGKFSRLCVEIDLHKPLLPYVEVEGVAYSVVYEGISMICFNCGCYGHVKANCTFVAANNSDNAGPMNMEQPVDSNNDNGPTETNSPKDKNETTEATSSSGGPGPWMLMSYKNKKTSPDKTPHNAAPSKSGSRFALLQTFTEDGDNAMNEQSPTPIEELTKSTPPSEPKIVTMWKRVQAKLPIDSSKSNSSDGSHPKNLGNQKQMKALKDITNGKTVPMTGLMQLGPANRKTSKPSLPSRRKTPIIHETATTPQFPTLSSLINDAQANPAQCIVPALFGHCPPENLHDDDSSQFMDASTDDLSSNGQVCSDLALEITPNDLIQDIDQDNPSMPSNLEGMTEN
jgi:hypothetical protein